MSEDADYADLFLRAAVAIEESPRHLREYVAHAVALRILRGEQTVTAYEHTDRRGKRRMTIYVTEN